MPMPQDKRRSQPAQPPKQDATAQAIALGRKLIADIDRALQEGRRHFEEQGLDYRALATQVQRMHGPAGAETLRAECAKVRAAIDGSELNRRKRFEVKPPSDGKSRRPRNMV